ncbi:MAG: shikimate kinase [Bacteroidetes bacterium]|nr:MAG: shikimate kinase [Bacteroidota bacterium]
MLRKTIGDIFREDGEAYFRTIEAKVIREVSNTKPAVVAVGGGLPCYHQNIDYMNECGFTVYLQATTSFIYNRLMQAKTPRPLLQGLNQLQIKAFIEQKLEARKGFYLQCNMVVDVPSKEPKMLVNKVVLAYQKAIYK